MKKIIVTIMVFVFCVALNPAMGVDAETGDELNSVRTENSTLLGGGAGVESNDRGPSNLYRAMQVRDCLLSTKKCCCGVVICITYVAVTFAAVGFIWKASTGGL